MGANPVQCAPCCMKTRSPSDGPPALLALVVVFGGLLAIGAAECGDLKLEANEPASKNK